MVRWQLIRHLPEHRIASASDPTSDEEAAVAESHNPAVWTHFETIYLIRIDRMQRTALARTEHTPWTETPYKTLPSEVRQLVNQTGVRAAAG